MNERFLREYRLGRLTPEQRHQIEARAFEDHAFEDQLSETGYDLLDDWARGDLTPADRAAVEKLFPPEQLDAARLLHSRMPAARLPQQRWTRWAFAAAILATLAPSVWFWQQSRRTQAELQAANQRIQRTASAIPPSRIVSLALHVPATRGSAVPILRIPADATLARITFAVTPGYGFYEISVESADRGLIFSQRTPPVAGTLDLTIPASILKAGNYEFLVSGVKDRASTHIATYPCQIVTQ